MDICIDTTLRKLSKDPESSSADRPVLILNDAYSPLRDLYPSYKKLREISRPKLGPVSKQKLESLTEACLGNNFQLLSRLSDQTRVNADLISENACSSCLSSFPSQGKVSKGSKVCVLCGRRFCANCIAALVLSTKQSGETSHVSACVSTCCRFIKALQHEIDPWFMCAGSSKTLSEMERQVTEEHTQLCSRLSNFEGLARFFSENRDKVPRADMLNTMPELEKSVNEGIDRLNSLVKKIQAVNCVNRDETVRRNLANFTALQVAKAKAQFHLSSRIYERLLHHNRAFSPQASPRFRAVNPAKPSGEIDLDSL